MEVLYLSENRIGNMSALANLTNLGSSGLVRIEYVVPGVSFRILDRLSGIMPCCKKCTQPRFQQPHFSGNSGQALDIPTSRERHSVLALTK